jgi:hypothetical protein
MVENETENLDDIFLEQNQMKNWKCEIMLCSQSTGVAGINFHQVPWT